MSLSKLRDCLGKSSLPVSVQKAIQLDAKKSARKSSDEMAAAVEAVNRYRSIVEADAKAMGEVFAQSGNQAESRTTEEAGQSELPDKNAEARQMAADILAEELGIDNFANIVFGAYAPLSNGVRLRGFVKKGSDKIYLNLAEIRTSDVLVETYLEEALHLVWKDKAVAKEWDALVEAVPAEQLEGLRQELFNRFHYTDAVLDEEAFNRIARRLGYEWLEQPAWKRFWEALKAAVRRVLGLKDETAINRISARLVQHAIRNQQRMEPETAGRRGAQGRADEGPFRMSQAPTDQEPPTGTDIGSDKPEPGKRFSQFGERVIDDPRLSLEHRFSQPEQFEERPQQGTMDEAAAIIKARGRNEALALFSSEASTLSPEVRIAGLMQLQMQFDALANIESAKGNPPGTEQYDSLADLAVEAKAKIAELGNVAGRSLNIFNAYARMSPEGQLRRFERQMEVVIRDTVENSVNAKYADVLKALRRLQQDFQQITGLDKSELRKAWESFAESGLGSRGRKAIYDVLMAMKPRKASPQKLIAELFADPDTIRAQMVKGGEALARQFFQLMAGPRPQQGALTEFDLTIQQTLSAVLRKVMVEQGLVSEHDSLQMKDLDRLVRSVSDDPLRLQKLNAADARMAEELAKIEDDLTREKLQQAWEEATAQMAETLVGEPLLRRIIHQELKTTNPDWNALFDTGKPRAEVTQALKDKTVADVVAKVQAKLTDPGSAEVQANMAELEQEIADAFDRIREVKFAQWLERRERIAQAELIKERKAAFLEALKGQGIVQRTIDRLAKVLSDTPTNTAQGPINPVQAVISEHIEAPLPDFVQQLKALGIHAEDAQALDRVINENRRRGEVVAREQALAQIIKDLKPKTAKARGNMDKLTRSVIKAAERGVLDRASLSNALAEAFGIPVMSPAQREEFGELATEISLLPEGSLRQEAVVRLNSRMAMFKGIPAMDALLGMWYGNILAGASTQAVNIYGNGMQMILRSMAVMIGNGNLGDAVQMLKGISAGAKQGWQEAKSTLKDGMLHKTLKMDDLQKLGALEVMSEIPNKNFGHWLAYLGSIGGMTKYAFRAMQAVDAVFWYSAYEGRAYLAASRALRERGLQPGTAEFNAAMLQDLGSIQSVEDRMIQAREELLGAGSEVTQEKIMRRAYEIGVQQRSTGLKEESDLWADRSVFQQKPEGIGRFVSGLLSAIQGLKLFGVPVLVPLAPFNRIVSNLFESSIDWTGVGIIRGLVGHHLTEPAGPNRRQFSELEKRERIAAGTFGILAVGLVYMLNEMFGDEPDEDAKFRIWAYGPRDKALREQWAAHGGRPFTMKIGDTYVSYAENPLGMLMAAMGGWADANRYNKGMAKKSTADRAFYAFLQAAQSFSSQGVLSSIGTTVDVLTGGASPKTLKKLPAQTITGMVPAQGFMRDVATLFDDTKIDDSTFYGALIRDIPVLKSDGKPSLNVLGEPIKIPGVPVVRRFAVEQKLDPVYAFLGRNELHIPALPQTIEIGDYLGKMKEPAKRRAMQLLALENGVMTPDQRYEFVKKSGAYTKQAVEKFMAKHAQIEPDKRERAQEVLSNMVGDARKRAMLELVKAIR